MPEVRVPQKDGTISISVGGDEPTTRTVTDHIVTVADKDLDHFLQVVDGATLAKPATAKKES